MRPANTSQVAAVPAEKQSPPGQYSDLIQYLFSGSATLAIVGRSGASYIDGVSTVAAGIAEELGASNKRTVIVAVNKLLRMEDTTVPEEMAFAPGKTSLVWHWPAPALSNVEFFNPRVTTDWLASLRHSFYAVLLDCRDIETLFHLAEVAAAADAAVITVEAGRTATEQLQREQRALQLSGARLAGTILIHSR